MLLKADDENLRKLAEKQRPFYQAPDFLKKKARGTANLPAGRSRS